MFLLIPNAPAIVIRLMCFFKFHYVSINSYLRIMSLPTVSTLNSIMFLLILIIKILLSESLITLNSIMFLLIHIGRLKEVAIFLTFKFHYVSINSCWHIILLILYHFTLNSIMFLLILLCKIASFNLRISLNSIMFLLIRSDTIQQCTR